MVQKLEVSVVVPISERHDNIQKLYELYSTQLEKMGKTFEFIFIVDGNFPIAYESILKLKEGGKLIKVIKFTANFGESTALLEGFQHAEASSILTLASYIQIEPSDLESVFAAYEIGNDLVITRRFPRKDPLINQLQSKIYHYFICKLTGVKFKDITSGMRLINKDILSEFVLYGDLHRFIPIFAARKGIKVKEVDVTQRTEDTSLRLVTPGVYTRRFLDILTLFFLVKFTQKPLRFFGLVGLGLFLPGFFYTGWLALLRISGYISLSDRPGLMVGILLMVFGIQIFSLGLVGELIIFSQSRQMEDYKVQEVIED